MKEKKKMISMLMLMLFVANAKANYDQMLPPSQPLSPWSPSEEEERGAGGGKKRRIIGKYCVFFEPYLSPSRTYYLISVLPFLFL